MGHCEKCINKYGAQMYFLFRVLVGFMFFQHGAGKLFGWFGGKMMGFSGLMGFVGIVEFLVGLAVLLGLFTRLAAFGGAIIMLGALFKAHLPTVWYNITSGGGELALMYFASFLVLMVYGNKKWNLEKILLNKETF
jgi:putative oxidoreductase